MKNEKEEPKYRIEIDKNGDIKITYGDVIINLNQTERKGSQ